MTENLLEEFEEATSTFFTLLSSFDQQQINTVPYEGSWTAAQTGEHVFKSDSMLLDWLTRATQPTLRAPDEQVAGIRATFLDFSTRLESPKEIVPTESTHEKEALIGALRSTRERLRKVISNDDLTLTVSSPIFGEPTKLELVNFVVVHTKRHSNQLRKIRAKVVETPLPTGRP
jgi:hypothetical protein